MSLTEPVFVSVEEAVGRLGGSMETLKWNIIEGHVPVYVKTPVHVKMFPSLMDTPTDGDDLSEYAKVEQISHWYYGDTLAFREMVILDKHGNAVHRTQRNTYSLPSRHLFVCLPEIKQQKTDPFNLAKEIFKNSGYKPKEVTRKIGEEITAEIDRKAPGLSDAKIGEVFKKQDEEEYNCMRQRGRRFRRKVK